MCVLPTVVVTVVPSHRASTPENAALARPVAKVPAVPMNEPTSADEAACGVSATSPWLRPQMTMFRRAPATAWRGSPEGHAPPSGTAAVDTTASRHSHTQIDAPSPHDRNSAEAGDGV